MSYLWFGFSKCNICFVYLFVQTLANSVWLLVMGPIIIYYWVLWLIELVSFFIVLIKDFEIWFSYCLGVNVFLSDLWFHANHFDNWNLFRRTCYSVKFSFWNCFEIGGEWILVGWLGLKCTLLLHWILAKIIFLSSLRWQLWQILISRRLFSKIGGAKPTWFHNVAGEWWFD